MRSGIIIGLDNPEIERNEAVFSTIVVGTDGSPDAEQALRTATEFAKLNPDTKIHVVAAFHPMSQAQLRAIANSLPDEFRSMIHGAMHVESILDSARSIMADAGVEAEYHEVNNYPSEAIVEAAETQDADLIVVGSRGEGMAKRLLHGSVSTNVFHHAPCAVLIVRNDQ